MQRTFRGPAVWLGIGLLACLAQPPSLDGQDAPRTDAVARGLVQSAKRTYEAYDKDYYEGFGPLERLYIWSRRWFKAQADTAEAERDQLTAAEAHLARMMKLQQLTKRRLDARVATDPEYSSATYYRLRAEQAVQRLKKGKERGG